MSKPPLKKTTLVPVKTALRLPPGLHQELHQAAELNIRSLNAEIVARLQVNRLDELDRKIDEVRLMLRQLLDQT